MKGKKIITTVLITALSIALMACAGKEETESTAAPAPPSTDESEAKETQTITLYYGETILAELEVEKGKTLNLGADGMTIEGYTPVIDGYTFMGWYATPNMTRDFDFANEIRKDLPIYAGFAAHEDDNREFYIVGSGKSAIMLASNWGGGPTAFDDEHKLTRIADENKYTITADLMEGDEFQFVINNSWHNQRGFGYIKETALPDGTEVFAGAGGLGDVSVKTMNIRVALSGNYTLTMTTFPAEDYYDTGNSEYSEDNKASFNMGTYDMIEWVRNGDVQDVPDLETNFYIKGAGVTQWENIYEDSYKLADVGGSYTLEIFLDEGEEFLFISTITQAGVTNDGTEFLRYDNLDETSKNLFDDAGGMGSNMIAKASGTYTFRYNESTKELSVTID